MSRNAATRQLIPVAALLVLAGTALAEDAADALKRVSDAMGSTGLKSIRTSATGVGYTYGQAFKPGDAWPKITIHSQVRTINFESASMREETTLSRAEPLGGGGYPPTGQQKNDQFLSGNYAWNVTAAGTVPTPQFVTGRMHQLWISPHGAVKSAIRNLATMNAAGKGARGALSFAFAESERFTATMFVDQNMLVERVESRFPDPVLGESTATTFYADYRDVGGIKFPGRIRQVQGGFVVLDVTVDEVQPNLSAEIQVPDSVRVASEKVVADRVADGVWFISGGTHNSVAIELKDSLVLVESPLSDARALPVIEQVRKLVPDKPLRWVINSHSHFDHAGGLRAAVAEGATIVTHEGNHKFYAAAFATHGKIAPDHLAKAGRQAKFQLVNDKGTISDGKRSIEIHRIKGSAHSDTFLMVYLPADKLLIEGDAYTPLAPNAPAPSPPNPNNVNLVENIERLQLAVERILPLHGRVVPLADLYAAVGKTPPK